jgi:hypothetical protein
VQYTKETSNRHGPLIVQTVMKMESNKKRILLDGTGILMVHVNYFVTLNAFAH